MTEVIHLHGVHPMRPEINGRSFSEIESLSPEVSQALMDRGMAFITSFVRNGATYGGHIIARDWDHAREIASQRGLGETVEGKLGEVIPA